MKSKKSLTDQLLYIYIIVVSLIIISLGIILPKTLLPIYEENIYSYLKQPLYIVGDNINTNTINSEVAYIYINNNDTIMVSDNLSKIIDIKKIDDLLDKIDNDYGKFKYKLNTYYYNTSKTENVIKIAITNDKYINIMRQDILLMIIIVVGITFILISLLIMTWSNNLVSRIKKLKHNIDNIDNDNFTYFSNKSFYEDELNSLAIAIDNMHDYLKEQEEYKNQMYQNISHDFKTPITVMKSYIEASEDGIETKDKTITIIKEQLKKLEIKVHSLLYLNKLNYIQDKKENLKIQYDVSKTIYAAVDKFKLTRPDIKFVLDIDSKNTIFRGSSDMWEAIIDNILSNFMRYADKIIKISVKNNKIILYNDGPNIDDNVLNNIFTPYEKGIKGVFGLGLSIVKKTLHFLEYDIIIENDKKRGVRFIIKEGKKLKFSYFLFLFHMI